MKFGTFLRAWLITALSDGLFSSVLSAFFYGSTVARLWQGVASVPFGSKALQSGSYVVVGLLMHLGVAFVWTLLFFLLASNVDGLRRLISTPAGAIAAAVVYGPIIWCLMSFGVIQAFTHKPPTINYRWWVQFFGHMMFVALPMIVVISRGPRTART